MGHWGIACTHILLYRLQPSRCLFVGNLGFYVTEDDLARFAQSFGGSVDFTRILRDRETQTSRGSGFIYMQNAEDAIKVCRFHHPIASKTLSLSLSLPGGSGLAGTRIIIIIIRQFVRCHNMSVKSLQGRRTEYATRIKLHSV